MLVFGLKKIETLKDFRIISEMAKSEDILAVFRNIEEWAILDSLSLKFRRGASISRKSGDEFMKRIKTLCGLRSFVMYLQWFRDIETEVAFKSLTGFQELKFAENVQFDYIKYCSELFG